LNKITLIAGKVHLQTDKVQAVRAAISYLYTGEPGISKETVEDILEVADYFQIAKLKSYCEDYLFCFRYLEAMRWFDS
jgi:hypothetical protein